MAPDSVNNSKIEKLETVDKIIEEYYEEIGGYNTLKSIQSKKLQGDYHHLNCPYNILNAEIN